nr:hypothetical protein [Verrucomicrobiota bacterium]
MMNLRLPVALGFAFAAFSQAAPIITPTANRGASNDAFSPPGSIFVFSTSSPVVSGTASQIFGATGSGEGDTAIFADHTIGTTYHVDFQAANPVLLSTYRAVVSDDEPSNNRAISALRIYTSTDASFTNLTLLSNVNLSSPYGIYYHGAIISIYDQFVAVSAQYFRLEFVNASVAGPRIIELDGNITPALKVLSITATGANQVTLQCQGAPNSKNTILAASDLTSGFTTTLATVTADANGLFQYVDTAAT